MSGGGHQEKEKNSTFFEETTVGIGFLYTAFAIGVLVTIFFFC